jgi:hypothetical protein
MPGRWASVVEYLSKVNWGGGRGVCLLSSFVLFEIRYVRYLMTFWCTYFMWVLIFDFGMFRLVSFLMECLGMTPLTPVVMVMRRLIFKPVFCLVLISGPYLVCFCSRAWSGGIYLDNM